MGCEEFIKTLGNPIEDTDEETFLLFTSHKSSSDLGFIDPTAPTLELSVAGHDLTIDQSPTLLTSQRKEGTTGAVVWRITPLVAEWLASSTCPLFNAGILSTESTILELGCGISGILPLAIAPKVSQYIATDQDYVFKVLRRNIEANKAACRKPGRTSKGANVGPRSTIDNVSLVTLDWETSSMASLSSLLPRESSIDLVLACDCIYNELLIAPFVRTCFEICQLRAESERPAFCLIAQQLRSDEVFSAFLSAFMASFHVWRVPEDFCGDALSVNNGYVLHLGILKSEKFDIAATYEKIGTT